MNKRILSMLSLCQKAGKLASGEFSCEKSLQSNSSFLVIVAADASENTKNKFKNKTFFYNVPFFIVGNIKEISRSIGKDNRAVLSVVDKGLADKIKSLIDNDC